MEEVKPVKREDASRPNPTPAAAATPVTTAAATTTTVTATNTSTTTATSTLKDVPPPAKTENLHPSTGATEARRADPSLDTKPSEASQRKASDAHADVIRESKEMDDEAPKTFPQLLMEILSSGEHEDTIAWLPHGRSFIIYKKKKFASQVIPHFFKATKFTSFTRKLNRWGFNRVTRGPEMGSYYHKLFIREDPSLCLRMSSHSSSKFQEHQSLIPAPMANMPYGMPFGMGAMVNPMMSMPGMNPNDLSQQNQMINHQLQQLQWQQFQLQQYQQQQASPHHPPPPPQQYHHPHHPPPPHHHPQPHHPHHPPPHGALHPGPHIHPGQHPGPPAAAPAHAAAVMPPPAGAPPPGGNPATAAPLRSNPPNPGTFQRV